MGRRKKRQPLPKVAAQRMHAAKRFKERTGGTLTAKLREEFTQIIQSKGTTIVKVQSNRVVIHDIYYHGNTYRAVYDKNRKVIVSFLPPGQHVEFHGTGEKTSKNERRTNRLNSLFEMINDERKEIKNGNA